MPEFIRGDFAPDGPELSELEKLEAEKLENWPRAFSDIDPRLEVQLQKQESPSGNPSTGAAEIFKTYNGFIAFCDESTAAIDLIFKKHFPNTKIDFGNVAQALAAYCLDALLRKK